jgi:hypothetical protein
MKRALLALTLLASAQGAAMPSDTSAQDLRAMVGHDHFAAAPSDLYAGVSDGPLKARLNTKVDATAVALADATVAKASTSQLLEILKEQLAGIDRDALDTEDAERVANLFEQMLDGLGIQSSDGILNDWLYGFDPA